jgi:hypothetical protein
MPFALKRLVLAIVANAFLVLLFVYSNFIIWSELNSEPALLRSLHFGPFWIQDIHAGIVTSGNLFSPVNGVILLENFPFWLFFVAIAVNLFFLYKLQKESAIL